MSRGGPRSKRLLLGPGHRPPRSGCPIKLLLLPVAIVGLLWRHHRNGGPR